MAKKVRFVRVRPSLEKAMEWRAYNPEDAPVYSTGHVFDEAVRALRGKHGIPEWVENDLDWREWVEDILDVPPPRRDAKWEEQKARVLEADKQIEAWVNEHYEKPELVKVGVVGETDWPALPANPWVPRK